MPGLYLLPPVPVLSWLSELLSVPPFSLQLLLTGLLGLLVFSVANRQRPPEPLFHWSRVRVAVSLLLYTAYTYGRFPVLVWYGVEGLDCARRWGLDYGLADALVLSPVAEELTYRVLPLGLALSLKSKFLCMLFLVIGAIGFGISHQSYDIGSQIEVGVAGLVYGLLFLRTAKPWVPILAHSVSNLLVILLELALHTAGYAWCN